MSRDQFLIGTGYLKTTSQSLLEFSQMTPKTTSADANSVAATPNPASDTLTTLASVSLASEGAPAASTQRDGPCQCWQHRELEIPSPAPGLTQHLVRHMVPFPFGPAPACGENSLAPCNLQTDLTTIPLERFIRTAHVQALAAPSLSKRGEGLMLLHFWIFFDCFDSFQHCRLFVHVDAASSSMVSLQERLEPQAELFPSPRSC